MPIPVLPREIMLQIAEISCYGYGYHHNLQLKACSQTSQIFCYVARQERFKEVKLKISKKRMKLAKHVFTNPEVARHVQVLELSFSDLDSKIDFVDLAKSVGGKDSGLGANIDLAWGGKACTRLRQIITYLAPTVNKLTIHAWHETNILYRNNPAIFFGVVVGLLSTNQFPLLRTLITKPPSCITFARPLWMNTWGWMQRIFGASALETYQGNLNRVERYTMDCYHRGGDPVYWYVRGFEEFVSKRLSHLQSLRIDALENRKSWDPAAQLHVTDFSTLTNLTNFMMSDTQISDKLSEVLPHLTKLKKLYFYHVRLIHTTERWCNVFRNVVLLQNVEYFYAAGVGYSQEELLELWCWVDDEDHSDICTQYEDDLRAMTEMGEELDERGVLKNKMPLRFCSRSGLQLP